VIDKRCELFRNADRLSEGAKMEINSSGEEEKENLHEAFFGVASGSSHQKLTEQFNDLA
jgi:hypothetical protein